MANSIKSILTTKKKLYMENDRQSNDIEILKAALTVAVTKLEESSSQIKEATTMVRKFQRSCRRKFKIKKLKGKRNKEICETIGMVAIRIMFPPAFFCDKGRLKNKVNDVIETFDEIDNLEIMVSEGAFF